MKPCLSCTTLAACSWRRQALGCTSLTLLSRSTSLRHTNADAITMNRASALWASRRFISRVGARMDDTIDGGEEDAAGVVVETKRVPSGVATVTRKRAKPRPFVNADGYNVVEDARDGASPLDATDRAAADDGPDAEPPLVEFTVTEAEHLEKLFRRPVVSTKYLTEAESTTLGKLLFDGCYKDELTSNNKDALLYQASLELTWMEEWADGLLAANATAGASSNNTNTEPQTGRAAVVVKTPEDVRKLIKKAVLERVDLHKPLSYIIGSQPFFGCDILCQPPLLCPRPETEMWTHWLTSQYLSSTLHPATAPPKSSGSHAAAAASAARSCSECDHHTRHDTPEMQPLRVLDMCCGTGCIGVAIAKQIPSAEVFSVDLLEDAVRMTRRNATHNGVPDNRLHAIQSDLFEHFLEPLDPVSQTHGESGERVKRTVKPEFRHTFDVIVSNPPYVLPEQYIDLPRSITHWESKMALVGDDVREHKQYLYFQELCEYGAQLLKTPAQRHKALRDAPNLVIEVGLQAHLVASLMEKSGLFENVELHLDYANQERWVSATSLGTPSASK